MNGTIMVLLADDHTLFRQGLASILASYGDMEVVAGVPNDAGALRLARELSPGVVVTEVQAPFERAKKALRTLRSLPDPPEVVVCTALDSPRYARGLTGMGASAYVLKSSPAEHLVAAMRTAVLEPQVSDGVVGGMPHFMPERTEKGVEGVLTARELEVLILASRGLTNARIASALILSESTVKRHLANVYEKMGIGSRTEASREALLRGWITVEEVTAEEQGPFPSEPG